MHVAWHGKQSIPLHPPKVPQLHLVLGRGEGWADLAEEVTVLAVAVAEDGSPWQGAAPALEVSEGALEPWGPQGPDAFRWRWRFAPGAPRTARLSATLQAGLPPPPLELRRLTGPPARAELLASAPRAAPGAEVALRVKLTDLAGNAAAGHPCSGPAQGGWGSRRRRDRARGGRCWWRRSGSTASARWW